MSFENIKNSLLWLIPAIIIAFSTLFFIINSGNTVSKTDQDIFAYTVKIRTAVEELDKIFERAEINVNVMADSISNSYDIREQQDKAYNLKFIAGINGLVESVLSNSPSVDGSWFQINADLPFSSEAYNWFTFKEDQFVNVRDQFEGTALMNRQITPEDDPYYYSAVSNKKPTWSDVYTDPDTKQSMLTISAPVYKEGSLVGVVGIDINVESIKQILGQMQTILGNSELYLLDKKDKVILTQLYPNSRTDNYEFLKLFKNNDNGTVEYNDHQTKKTALLFSLSNGYKIAISIPNKGSSDETKHAPIATYVLLVLLVLLTISTTLAVANQLKINKLTEELEFFNKNSDA